MLEGEINYPTLEQRIKHEPNALGREPLHEVLALLEEKLYAGKERKRSWQVERKGDPKTILTPFGQLEYRRTYYHRKQTRRYSYLLDE